VLSAGQSKNAKSESEKIKVKSARPKGAATEHRCAQEFCMIRQHYRRKERPWLVAANFLWCPPEKKGERYEGICSWICVCQDLVVTG
jgi:hypothetical protein